MAKKGKKHPSPTPLRLAFRRYALLFFLCFAYVLLLFGLLAKVRTTPVVGVLIPKKLLYNTVTPTTIPRPTLIPSPTATPTPTLAPPPTLAGYCLPVPVLMYHHVQPWDMAKEKGQTSLTVDSGTFEQQMAYLSSQGYMTITAKQLIDALITKSGLPPKSIVITFDDGYRDNHTYAFPVLQKYRFTGNLLLASGLMEGADYLTWGQVQEMKNSGLFYFINHTWSHYALPRGDAATMATEIDTARTQIEEHTGQKVKVFGYPYGSFNDLAIQVLQQKGYTGAFTTVPGAVQCDAFLMALRRTRVGNVPLSYYGF